MSKEIEIFKVDKVARESSLHVPENLVVVHIKPPEDGPGLSAGENFLKSTHHVTFESSLRNIEYDASTTSFEMWYEDEELDFYYVMDTKEAEKHYRRQLVGHYDKISIAKKILSEKRFINIEKGEYVAMCRLMPRRSSLEPISRGEGGRGEDEPLKPIINEIDSKSGVKFLVQVLYKPLPEIAWNKLFGSNPSDISEELRDLGREETAEESGDNSFLKEILNFSSGNFSEVDDPSSAAGIVEEREGEPIYWIEPRIMCISESRKTAEMELSSLIDLYNTYYRGPTNQTLATYRINDPNDFFLRFIEREYSKDNIVPLRSKKEQLKNKIKQLLKINSNNNFVGTALELANLSHLPSQSEVSTSGVNYKDNELQSEFPPEAERFKPVTEEDKKNWKKKQQKG